MNLFLSLFFSLLFSIFLINTTYNKISFTNGNKINTQDTEFVNILSKSDQLHTAKSFYEKKDFVKAADAFYAYLKTYGDDPYSYYMIAMST